MGKVGGGRGLKISLEEKGMIIIILILSIVIIMNSSSRIQVVIMKYCYPLHHMKR
jgi:hypothetical protein